MKKTTEKSMLLLPIILLVSAFSLNPFLQKVMEFPFVYINKLMFIFISLFIIIYVVYISKIVQQNFIYSGKTKNLLIIVLGLLLIYDISIFIHPIGEGIFFLNMLLINLVVSIILSFIFGWILNHILKKPLLNG